MMFPPCLMRLKVVNPGHHINLWIPVFLVWIVLGVPVLALSLALLIVVLVCWYFEWGRDLLKGMLALYGVICASRDLKIDVDHGNRKLLFYFK
jgi:hypothetical protein